MKIYEFIQTLTVNSREMLFIRFYTVYWNLQVYSIAYKVKHSKAVTRTGNKGPFTNVSIFPKMDQIHILSGYTRPQRVYYTGVSSIPYPIIKQKLRDTVSYYKAKVKGRRFITWMNMHENPIIKHSISLRKFDRVFANPIIKHLNSSKTLK